MKTKINQIDGLSDVFRYQEASIDLNKIDLFADVTIPVKFTTDIAIVSASIIVEVDPGSTVAQLYYADGTAVTTLPVGSHEIFYDFNLLRFILTDSKPVSSVGATLYTYNNIGGAL